MNCKLNLNDMTVDEIIMKYQHDTQLLSHALAAKTYADKQCAARELQQAENARLQSLFMEPEIIQTKDNYYSSGSSMCSYNTSHVNIDDSSSEKYTPSVLSDTYQDFYYNDFNHALDPSFSSLCSNQLQAEPQQLLDQWQENIHSFILDSIYCNNSDALISTSLSFNELQDVPCPLSEPRETTQNQNYILSVASSSESTKKAKSQSSKSGGNTAILKLKSGRSIVHRTLSYENVMNLQEYNTKITNEINNKNKQNSMHHKKNILPTEPLDHDKVMEALRAKLKRCGSHQSSPEASATYESLIPPPPQPPNVHPTTGVLQLNLKSRKKRSLARNVSKRPWSRSNSMP